MHYAAARILNPALTFAFILLRAERFSFFPIMDECVDYGSHKHLPDSI